MVSERNYRAVLWPILASAVFTALLTAGYRSDQAGKAIQEANPDLQDYLKGLEQIVGWVLL